MKYICTRFSAYIIDSCTTFDGLTHAQIFYNRFSSQLTAFRNDEKLFESPDNAVSARLRFFLANSYFKQFSSACILLNVACMLFFHSDASPSLYTFLSVQNAIFFGELCLEVLLYLVAEGPGIFLPDTWRAFELVLAIGSAYGYAQTPYLEGGLSTVSVFFQV